MWNFRSSSELCVLPTGLITIPKFKVLVISHRVFSLIFYSQRDNSLAHFCSGQFSTTGLLCSLQLNNKSNQFGSSLKPELMTSQSYTFQSGFLNYIQFHSVFINLIILISLLGENPLMSEHFGPPTSRTGAQEQNSWNPIYLVHFRGHRSHIFDLKYTPQLQLIG